MKEKLYLTSRQNPTIKWLSSLSEKKYRDESQSFLLEGKKLCEEGMRAGLVISHIVVREDNHEWQSLALQYCQNHEDTQFIVTNDSCFSKISQEKSPEGVIIVAKYLDNFKYYYIINNNTLSDASFSGIVFFKHLLQNISIPSECNVALIFLVPMLLHLGCWTWSRWCESTCCYPDTRFRGDRP